MNRHMTPEHKTEECWCTPVIVFSGAELHTNIHVIPQAFVDSHHEHTPRCPCEPAVTPHPHGRLFTHQERLQERGGDQ